MKRFDTLRVSVTDRCNLRCVYCMPPEGLKLFGHDEILSFEEIERTVRAALSLGVTKIRLTGGEPLVRRGIIELIRRLRSLPGLEDLPLTTNGVMLEKMAAALKEAGLSRVTVSLDTLRPERFARIAGRPWLDKVLAGIEAAMNAGLGPVKINTVLVPGENDDEVMDFVELAQRLDVDVRFIERMPIRHVDAYSRCGLTSDAYVPTAKLLAEIEEKAGALEPLPAYRGGGPARLFRVPGGQGRIGVISPLTQPFCGSCSRLRLTPEGKLRVCLASDLELDLRAALRAGATDAEIVKLLEQAVAMKPNQDSPCFTPGNRSMHQIGG